MYKTDFRNYFFCLTEFRVLTKILCFRNVAHLWIQRSDLGVIFRDAFFGLDNITNLYMISNKIDAIEQFHLNSNFSVRNFNFTENHVLKAPRPGDTFFQVTNINVTKNRFPCDCQIHYVLASDFVNVSVKEFLEHNYCIATAIEYKEKSMSKLDLDAIASCNDAHTKDSYGAGPLSVCSNCLIVNLIFAFLYLFIIL